MNRCHPAMDRRILRSSSCNGSGKNPVPSSPAAVSRSASSGGIGSKNGDAAGERKALLPKPKQLPGGMAQKGRKRPNRRVQWKDRHGSKLTDVREFQPSDSSDSDDEYLDTCICSIM